MPVYSYTKIANELIGNGWGREATSVGDAIKSMNGDLLSQCVLVKISKQLAEIIDLLNRETPAQEAERKLRDFVESRAWIDSTRELVAALNEHRERLESLACMKLPNHDFETWFLTWDRLHGDDRRRRYTDAQERIEKLKTITTVDDLIRLSGVGTVTMSKILAAVAKQYGEDDKTDSAALQVLEA